MNITRYTVPKNCLGDFSKYDIIYVFSAENGPIQLWRSEIFFDREWGNICRDITFNSNGANVICHS